MTRTFRPRRMIIEALAVVILGLGAVMPAREGLAAPEAGDDALKAHFAYLSENGNSNCSRQFMESIATMPVTARLQGSCCSPMDEHRYIEQVKGLRKYNDIALIPPDPYDIPGGLAQQLLPRYADTLAPHEQAAYGFAMENSDEKGPCCCQCWRWHVYGGLAKYLIREHGFTGEQVAEVWDLSDGCGGSGDHSH
ncbi:hypothetical protein [Chelativorans intermedius]|uniref:Uncharacterized protein n=1 Tax=Chelativorans intermedius TaxID=515947 RepID=A0ABV6DBC7_9HYPH|nr:hypothetical protein [Chelativorans intermedius]MCT9000271.1 hypothetical protein [Chelativorans intermedius]